MTWEYAKIFFPHGRITPEFVTDYVARYSVDIEGPQEIAGQWFTLEPGESSYSLSVIFIDNPSLALFRKASMYDGTLQPTPIHEPPLAAGERPEDREPVGHTMEGYWPSAFLAHIRRTPQPEPEFFDGVFIMEAGA